MNTVELKYMPNIYFLGNSKNHLDNKLQILNEIKTSPFEETCNISKCDWNISRELERVYKKTFFDKILFPFLNDACLLINATKFIVHNFWFQQYEKNSEHGWHIHEQTNYTGVYYLEYPDLTAKTDLYCFYNKNSIEVDLLNEGDILIFPSNIVHRAPKIKNDKRKTIISFNMSFTGFNLDKFPKHV